ncbi:MAG TPA: PD-(D/E)XK nuclease family protein [Blastocatellia bacterium]|nr:PD-(D/E)XK nuclease family protein [Blastocatellia bacterium]
MSKQIWLAPILSDNRDRLIERGAEVLRSGPAEALLYIAASRPLLDLTAARLLDGVRNRGVWGSLPVHLFRGFARFVLATVIDAESGLPLAPRVPIDQHELPLKRSLLSQIIKRLARDGKLGAIARLAGREGCTATVASVIGEIQRAGKTPDEFAAIIESRAQDFYQPPSSADRPAIPRQIDFDRDIGIIYSAYASALARSELTEDDADQLRTLEVLRGEVDGRRVSVPWLGDVRLLVLDGFFDFTPVQGEMLRLLIPQIPEVIVNLNRDQRNAEVFRPFSATIDQLNSMATFETKAATEELTVAGMLSPLRERLFNPLPSDPGRKPPEPQESGETQISLLDCANRETEIRAIAKRIKRLVLVDGHALIEIGLIVRELASYAETIARVFDEESIPCSLRRRIQLSDVPAARASVKLFELLVELSREGPASLKVSALADLMKSGYFRLSEDELESLGKDWDDGRTPAVETGSGVSRPSDGSLWNADELENVIAFVGAELRVDRWLKRARQLTHAPVADIERDLKSDDEDEVDPDETSVEGASEPRIERRPVIRAEPVEVPLPGSERKPKPAREMDPAAIARSALIVKRLGSLLGGLPCEGRPRDLATSVRRLLDRLQFAGQVRGPSMASDRELPTLALDMRGLEGLRRAVSAAVRSIEICEPGVAQDEAPTITLTTLLDETLRCVKSQSLMTSGADPSGLRVLEATDARGLSFRAVFIAGLTEGGFPLRASRDWIYPHEERERLREYGLTLEDISPDTLLKEEHYFYQAACRATERLYLSRPLVLEDGSETVASYYIEEVARAVSPAQIAKETVRSDFDGRALFESSRSSELALLLVRQDERSRHRAQRDGNFSHDLVARLLSTSRSKGYLSESAGRRIEIERERGGRSFGAFDGIITDPALLARLAEHYGRAHSFSASELSLYGRCPFKFFVEKVLKLEPRGEAALDLSALDAGSLLHEALRRFFEKHRGQRLTDLDRQVLKRELGEVADEVFDEHERTVPPINPQVWKIDRATRKLLLEQVLDYEFSIESKSRAKDVRPAYFELAFGMTGGAVDPRSTDQQLELHRDPGAEGETARLRGQIDRVDEASNGTLIAYDYKLSRGPGLDDMSEGRALQLHIYLSALERLFFPGSEIAGGGYYTMKGVQDRRNKGLYRATMHDYTGVGTRTASTLGDSEWIRIRAEMESRIWEFVDGVRAGRFPVLPSAPDASCPHCDFSAVCRYEKFRIRRKQSGES